MTERDANDRLREDGADGLRKDFDAAPRQKPSGNPTHGVQLEDFYAYMVEHRYIFVPSRQIWPASSVDARVPSVGRVKASSWLDQNRPVEQMTWAPGEPTEIRDRLIAEGGWFERRMPRVQLYRPPVIDRAAARRALAAARRTPLRQRRRAYYPVVCSSSAEAR